jgi:hypothetical protein
MNSMEKIEASGISAKLLNYMCLFIPDEAEIIYIARLDNEAECYEEALVGYTLYHEFGEPCLFTVYAKIMSNGSRVAVVSHED